MNYKYVAVDVDGTLLDDQDHYNRPRLTADIEKLKQLGVDFIIASGNSVDALHSLFKGCPITNYVAENGGRIIVNGREVHGYPHQWITVKRLWNYLRQLPPVDLMSISGATQTFIPDRFRSVAVPYYPHHSYFTTLQEITEPAYNVNVNWQRQRLPQSRINQIVQQINHDFPEVNATYSGAFGIDILPTGVNKAVGLQRFVAQTGGQLSQVIAIGDTSNDVEMVKAAGLGVAMLNATPDLKSVADRITMAGNNNDGMLQEIEAIFKLSEGA